jgi:hypothetical protein
VLQLHGCVWAEGDDAWLPAGAWNERFDVERAIEDGEPVVLGFDGSHRRDATALVGCALDGHLFKVGVWERPAGAPEDGKVPRREVDRTLAEAMKTYDVRELACDPPGWHRETRTGTRPTARWWWTSTPTSPNAWCRRATASGPRRSRAG